MRDGLSLTVVALLSEDGGRVERDEEVEQRLAEGADDRLERELLVVCTAESGGSLPCHLDVLRSEPERPGAVCDIKICNGACHL